MRTTDTILKLCHSHLRPARPAPLRHYVRGWGRTRVCQSIDRSQEPLSLPSLAVRHQRRLRHRLRLRHRHRLTSSLVSVARPSPPKSSSSFVNQHQTETKWEHQSIPSILNRRLGSLARRHQRRHRGCFQRESLARIVTSTSGRVGGAWGGEGEAALPVCSSGTGGFGHRTGLFHLLGTPDPPPPPTPSPSRCLAPVQPRRVSVFHHDPQTHIECP